MICLDQRLNSYRVVRDNTAASGVGADVKHRQQQRLVPGTVPQVSLVVVILKVDTSLPQRKRLSVDFVLLADGFDHQRGDCKDLTPL